MAELITIAALAIYAAGITSYAVRQHRHHRKRVDKMLSFYEMAIRAVT